MKCKNCNKESGSNDIYCTNCGEKLVDEKKKVVSKEKITKEELAELLNGMDVKVNNDGTLNFNDEEEEEDEKTDSNGYPALYLLLGLFSPLVGFIMYLLLRKNRKKDANYAIIGASIIFGFYILAVILRIIFNR